jgi:hypothetical protein
VWDSSLCWFACSQQQLHIIEGGSGEEVLGGQEVLGGPVVWCGVVHVLSRPSCIDAPGQQLVNYWSGFSEGTQVQGALPHADEDLVFINQWSSAAVGCTRCLCVSWLLMCHHHAPAGVACKPSWLMQCMA